jgi:hypothetical protein
MSRLTVKSVPLQALIDSEGSGRLRLPDFKTVGKKVARLSPLFTGCLYHQEIFLVLIFISVRG